jgi:hypothetical protein
MACLGISLLEGAHPGCLPTGVKIAMTLAIAGEPLDTHGLLRR